MCTAADVELWNQPEFLQTIIWGPDNIARGGIHLLAVEESGRLYLLLPGINPSLTLIEEAGADIIYDTIIRFAGRLAQSWNLSGVWIPASLHIASNRGPIGYVIRRQDYPVRTISPVRFGVSPYSYTIDRVFEATHISSASSRRSLLGP